MSKDLCKFANLFLSLLVFVNASEFVEEWMWDDSISHSTLIATKTNERYNNGSDYGQESRNELLKRMFLLLFEKPYEPMFLPKGPRNTVFVLPEHYWVDRYRDVRPQLEAIYQSESRLGKGVGERFKVKDLGERAKALDDVVFFGLESYEHFVWFPYKALDAVTQVFLDASLEDFLSLAVYVRERFNPSMFHHIMLMVVLQREDTWGITLPALVEMSPELYIDTDTMGRVMEQNYVVPAGLQVPVVVPPRLVTSSEQDPEQRIAYFREDLAINMNHKQWHSVYPYNTIHPLQDRRGEIFYYFHQQILTRYSFERLCNNLTRTVPMRSFRDVIPEGYFPKLSIPGGRRIISGRVANSRMSDVYYKDGNNTLPLSLFETWERRIFEGIHNGKLIKTSGQTVDLDEEHGLELVSNVLESNGLSVNLDYYGNLHNLGHLVYALANDPKGVYKEQNALMLRDQQYSLRDPFFYRYHGYVNSFYLAHKYKLPPYTEDQLSFSGVTVKEVRVTVSNEPDNSLYTMWQQHTLDITSGMNFVQPGPVVILFTHLHHGPFTYNIQIENKGENRKATVRLHLSPKFDERGLPLSFKDQANLFIEMDKFTVNLKSGMNTVERKSVDSVSTIPYEKRFVKPNSTTVNNLSYNGCGWPHHMLLPKGTAEGFPSQLFVMITDYDDDKVEGSSTYGKDYMFERGATLCGQRGKYPDRHPMLYPFDRLPREGVADLRDFLTPNMLVTDVTIYHRDELVQRA